MSELLHRNTSLQQKMVREGVRSSQFERVIPEGVKASGSLKRKGKCWQGNPNTPDGFI